MECSVCYVEDSFEGGKCSVCHNPLPTNPKHLDALVVAVVYCAYRQYLATPYESRDKTVRVSEEFRKAWRLADVVDNPSCPDECCSCTRDGFHCCKCGN